MAAIKGEHMEFDLLGERHSKDDMSVLDEDLSFLATQAALEFDELIEGIEVELEAIPRLSNVISNNFQSITIGGQGFSLDPATATIMNRAFHESELAQLETVDELVQKSLELAKDLQLQSDPNLRNGGLANMKRFCIALAKCSAAYRESVLGNRPKHPYRK